MWNAFLTALTFVGGIVIVMGLFMSWVGSMLMLLASDVSARGKIVFALYAFFLPVAVLTLLIGIGPYL